MWWRSSRAGLQGCPIGEELSDLRSLTLPINYVVTVPGPYGPWVAFGAEFAISFLLVDDRPECFELAPAVAVYSMGGGSVGGELHQLRSTTLGHEYESGADPRLRAAGARVDCALGLLPGAAVAMLLAGQTLPFTVAAHIACSAPNYTTTTTNAVSSAATIRS